MRKILFILVTCLLLGGCAPSKKQDFKQAIETIQKNHPSLYENISQQEFTKKCQDVENKLEKQTDIENYYSIKELLASVRNAHTNAYYDFSLLPICGFIPKYFDDGLRIIAIEKDKQQYLGYEIIAINDLSIDEIYKRFQNIVSYDTEAWKFQMIAQEMIFIDAYKYLGITNNDEITLTLQQNDEIKELTFKAITNGSFEDKISSLVQLQPTKETLTFKNNSYYSVHDIDGILYIQYNQCQKDPKYPIKDFAADIEKKMNAQEYDKVVFDLRYNSGGNSSVIQPVFDVLQNQRKHRYIHFYTLIGTQTYSSGVRNAIDTITSHYALYATLVGNPTGGNIKVAGDMREYKMKTFPCSLYYSTQYFEDIPGKSGSLQPDVKIPSTFKDYQSGIDPAFEYVRKQ